MPLTNLSLVPLRYNCVIEQFSLQGYYHYHSMIILKSFHTVLKVEIIL